MRTLEASPQNAGVIEASPKHAGVVESSPKHAGVVEEVKVVEDVEKSYGNDLISHQCWKC